MKLTIDTKSNRIDLNEDGVTRQIDLYSREGFELISRLWVDVGWNQKHLYRYSWMGRPIIQLPDDLVRVQEVIHAIRPDVIIETGVAHGGSLIFYASLCKAMEHGRVIGVDIEIRAHNRAAIESHPLASYIALVEGNSVAADVVQQVHGMVRPGETTLVLLDSNHTKAHVLSELRAYHDLVSPGSYIVATDGVMKWVANSPRGRPEWVSDNPEAAAAEFLRERPEFVLEPPAPLFNESELTESVTHWPGAWLRRRPAGF